MDDIVANYIRARHIDSYQKLRLLLFLHQHPEFKGTGLEYAERLYLGGAPLLEGILTDLQRAGIVDSVEDRYTLHDEPGVRSILQRLTEALEDPLARQEILDIAAQS